MKRFIKGSRRPILVAALLLAGLPVLRMKGCVAERSTHNAYVFSVFHRSLMEDRFQAETDVFWKKYVGHDADFYSYLWGKETVLEVAKKRNDKEMVDYLMLLNGYLSGNNIFNGWEYPTKEQLQHRDEALQQMLSAAKAYRGTRLRQQYALAQMRANFGLKRYQDNVDFWTQQAQKLAPSVYRDIMRNLYAGSLLRLGRKKEAVEIYAEQEDFRSLKYCVRKFRNLAGIKSVYQENPNSATLLYLVQDFVNNVQETMDGATGEWDEKMLSVLADEIDSKVVYRTEARQFITFARGVVAEGKTHCPSLWQSAIGCLEYQMGQHAKARADLAKALKMAGTPRMRDNARAIYAANSVFVEPLNDTYGRWLVGELQWLEGMAAREGRDSVMTDDHYAEVKERMVYRGLVPRLMRKGRKSLALTVMSMMNEDLYHSGYSRRTAADSEEGQMRWNEDYYGEYFEALDRLPLDNLKALAAYMQKEPKDVLGRFAWRRAYRDAEYYNDLIGTRLLAMGRFAEAQEYLGRVSLAFLNRQNIVPYACLRRFDTERWLGKQTVSDSLLEVRHTLTSNKKIDFCRRILAVQSLWMNMRPSEERRQKAYELASLYYQASYLGDCWWLTQYGWSSTQDSIPEGRMDFVQKAVDLLGESVQSTDFNLKQNSLYALAFIPSDQWCYRGWDEDAQTWYDDENPKPRPLSRQYKAIAALYDFVRANVREVAGYVYSCDVLEQFARVRR